MKKTVLFTAALFAVTAASAQTGEITSNRGENWLSQDGDWGLTFDANPLLNYAGNLFNGHQGNTIGNGITFLRPDFAIRGKKLIDANTAYRGALRIGFGSDKTTTKVPDQAAGAAADATVENVDKNNNMNINLGFGLEKRVGSTRVVGVYGAQIGLGIGSSKETFEYGNPLNAGNPAARVTENKNGSTLSIGLSAFAGVEWFCAPKISLSGEYTWGLAMNSTGFGTSTSESFVNNSVVSTTNEGATAKQNSFSIDTGVTGATVGVNFYFQ
ncbi:MAG: hypothetical protein IPN44_00525 [Flavobacteriales bacterium]|nr:hypothetical protein [Flavobacteriales bacterium]